MKSFMLFSVEDHLKATYCIEKNRFWHKKFFKNFWPFPAPPGVPHFSGLGALIKNRLGYSSNLAHWSLHAKFQPIRTIQLARAMGMVQFLAPHLVIGGHLYNF